MEKRGIANNKVHCLVLPFQAVGHMNPMLQFSKQLQLHGVRVTLVTTHFYSKSMQELPPSMALETISDGYDNGRVGEAAKSFKVYNDRFWQVGSETFAKLIEKLGKTEYPVDCVIYDPFMPWALDVAKRFGVVGAAFLTQNLVV